MFRLALM